MTFASSILNSVTTNPDAATVHQTSGSSDWLWAVLAILIITDLAIIANSFRGLRNHLLHQLAIIIVTTAAIAYFCMASNLGHTPIAVQFANQSPLGSTRSIYYVRYIMWFINAPLLLLLAYYGSGFPISGVWSALFMCDVAVVCGLVGALVRTSYKWGFYAFGVCALFYVIAHMFTTKRSWPSPTGRTRGGHLVSSSILAVLALIYPIVWGLAEGGNRISVVAEMIWYGIMDVLIFSLWVLYFLWIHSAVELDGTHPSGGTRSTKATNGGAV